MIGVVVPAHNEESHIGACLESLHVAARCPRLGGEDVMIVVALDGCSDNTEAIVRGWGATPLKLSSRNVGVARARGAYQALLRSARWLAFTDADSTVAPNWLSTQLALKSVSVCGTIEVRDWTEHSASVRNHHKATYRDVDGHRHIHSANWGVASSAYMDVGGFQPLASSEDVALVHDLQARGATIAWSAAPRVVTSARRHYRAPGGFGEARWRDPRTPCRSPRMQGVSEATFMSDLNWLQWPAMAVTVAASWLVASSEEKRRNVGFWVFLVSNALWVAWGWVTGAIALVVLQICLAGMNIRGAKKNDS